jgi:aryl-alcohol dehydrogenase-like predicted oxidoreductase
MRYGIFGSHTGLRVSEIVLGTGVFGTRWGHGSEPEEALRILNKYAEAGGNFIDTSNNYQFGQSEELLGEFLRGRRDEFVLATKFSQSVMPDGNVLSTGNSRLAMVSSVEASLRRLNTDRIDLYWVHYPDNVTPSEEIVRGFEDLARAGKILFAGLSNFPAWRVARAATIAEMRGALPIAALQVEHSLIERTTEQELLPMGHALGLGVVTWSPLGGGVLSGKYRRGESGRAQGLGGRVFQAENSAQRTAVLDELEAVAKELGTTPSGVAIAWVMAMGSRPIIGPRTVQQLEDNLGAAEIRLPLEVVARLDRVSEIPAVFPHRLLPKRDLKQMLSGGEGVRSGWPVA